MGDGGFFITVGQLGQLNKRDYDKIQLRKSINILLIWMFTVFVAMFSWKGIFSSKAVWFVVLFVIMLICASFLTKLLLQDKKKINEKWQKEKYPLVDDSRYLPQIVIYPKDGVIAFSEDNVVWLIASDEKASLNYSKDMIDWEVLEGTVFAVSFTEKTFLKVVDSEFVIYPIESDILDSIKEKAIKVDV